MPNNRDTTPDLIFCTENIRTDIASLEVIPDIGSDHLAILLTLDTSNLTRQCASPKEQNFTQADVQKINQDINCFLEHQNTTIREHLIEVFNNKLAATIVDNTPKQKRQPFLHTLPPFIIN